MALCRRRPPAHFLSKLGAEGDSYAELSVRSLSPEERPQVPALESFRALQANTEGDEESPQTVPAELCETPRAPAGSSVRARSLVTCASACVPGSPRLGQRVINAPNGKLP